MRSTTEKSVEVNILRHLANCLEERTHRPFDVESFCRRFASHKIGSNTGSPFGKDNLSDFKENYYPYSKKSFKKYHLKLKDVFYMHIEY